jgi:hypothetical protein
MEQASRFSRKTLFHTTPGNIQYPVVSPITRDTKHNDSREVESFHHESSLVVEGTRSRTVACKLISDQVEGTQIVGVIKESILG